MRDGPTRFGDPTQRLCGVARFTDPHSSGGVIQADGTTNIGARLDVVLIATGSSPLRPPEFPFEHPRVHDSNEILEIEELPRVLAVVGAGCDRAPSTPARSRALGIEVHLVDGRDALLPFPRRRSCPRRLPRRWSGTASASTGRTRVTRCEVRGPKAIALTLSSGQELVATDSRADRRPRRKEQHRGAGSRRCRL
jgi:NAD(P) transhydrogenase